MKPFEVFCTTTVVAAAFFAGGYWLRGKQLEDVDSAVGDGRALGSPTDVIETQGAESDFKHSKKTSALERPPNPARILLPVLFVVIILMGRWAFSVSPDSPRRISSKRFPTETSEAAKSVPGSDASMQEQEHGWRVLLPKKGLSRASVVFGVASGYALTAGVCGVAAIIAGLLSLMSRKREPGMGAAIAGIALGICGFALQWYNIQRERELRDLFESWSSQR